MTRRTPFLARASPHLLTGMRLALAPVLYLLIVGGRGDAAAACLVLAMVTDALDGPLARRFGVASRAGAHFDFWADFVLIEAVFSAFAMSGAGPWAIPLLTAIAFGFFVATARLTPAIYDPVGRNIGGILMGSAFGVLALRDLLVAQAVFTVALGALALTLCARAAFVAGAVRRSEPRRPAVPCLPSIRERRRPPSRHR